MDYLTFALPKGRLAHKAMDIFKEINIHCDEINTKSRKLIFTNEENKHKFFLSKTSDVPTYVENGVADIGIVGRDTLLEENRNIFEVCDLKLGQCKMIVAGFPNTDVNKMGSLKVATKYPNITRKYFHNKGINVDIVKLNGSVELGPIVGLSHVIVDIVETGTTLKENGLIVLDEICDLSARLVVNKVSMKRENQRIGNIIKNLRRVL
ncbi:MAG: ATP phosphoribosyltransferase [Lachnospirales bacterium]